MFKHVGEVLFSSSLKSPVRFRVFNVLGLVFRPLCQQWVRQVGLPLQQEASVPSHTFDTLYGILYV